MEKYGSYSKLLRVTAYVLRFVYNLRHEQKKYGEIITEELNCAEVCLIKMEQNHIVNDKHFNNWQKQFNLVKDEYGLLRLKGRFGNTKLPLSRRCPMLLRHTSHFTKLVILDAHRRVKHLRLLGTLNELREKFWIPKARRTVKSIISKCVFCKVVIGKTMVGPSPPDLPSFRVASDFAFRKIGLDFAGPLYVKEIYNDSDDLHKCYICLFTCASTRNTHLELTPDMGTNALIRCLRRFISRRGSMEFVISDNFKTFLSDSLQQYLASERVTWTFILPKSPWWGGFYERLIRIVKEALKKTIGSSCLTYEELETVLCEIEMIINSRPLTYIYDNNDEDEPLTPSHLVIGRRLMSRDTEVNLDDNIDDDNGSIITARYRYLRSLLDHYWARYSREYLHELREKHLLDAKREKSKNYVSLDIGDMVLIKDDKLKRNQWKKGVVHQLLNGNDNLPRGAILRTMTNNKLIYIKRPFQRLVPLELLSENNGNNHNTINGSEPVCITDDVENVENDEFVNVRPKRIAALTGELRRRVLEDVL